ncbi:MAG TPA: hypothetical protein VFA11_01465 [Acidimicrobiales bacterium]|nr:hypothetical protein [Acidimicrobiales bacterium]
MISKCRGSVSRAASSPDAGVGLISTLVGFLICLALLLLAVQVSLDLWSRSVLSAVAYDAARVVAGSDSAAAANAVPSAEGVARQELGRAGGDVSFRWALSADEVTVTLSMTRRSLMPAALSRPLGLDHVTRTAQVRRERVR